MKRHLILGSVLAMMLTSCATIISGSKQNVKFASTPSQATIFVNGKEIGKTPLETKLARKEDHKVSIQLDGYVPYEIQLTKKFNEWYIGNVLFGGIIGLVIDPITGALYKLTPKEVNAQLQKGTAFQTDKNGIYIAVSLEKDENWTKIGQLEKL